MKVLLSAVFILCLTGMLQGQEEIKPVYENQHYQAAYDYLFSQEEQLEADELQRPVNQKKLNQFWEKIWKRRDPTEETEYNEIRELFIRRVDDTSLFKGINDFGDSWKKDQGRVYIIYGAPDEIIKSPYGPKEQDSFEIWVYRENEDENSRRVEIIFVEDIDGYKLKTSITFPRKIFEERELPDIPQRFEGR